LISTVVVVTVTLSLLLHSLTIAPGIRRLASTRMAAPTP
jgi:NhaP-type Na+/H+ or K+/H+ antiporter